MADILLFTNYYILNFDCLKCDVILKDYITTNSLVSKILCVKKMIRCDLKYSLFCSIMTINNDLSLFERTTPKNLTFVIVDLQTNIVILYV